MSLMTEILVRLTGMALAKAQLDMGAAEVRKLGDCALDLEKRVIRLEGAPLAPTRKRLSRKPTDSILRR